MNTYSKWNEVARYKLGYIDISKENTPKNNLLAVKTTDNRIFEIINNPLNINDILKNIENGTITNLDKDIICIVALSTYATIKQITELLILMGYKVNDNIIKESINRLHKNDLILLSKLVNEETHDNIRVVSLNKYGSEIAKRLEVIHNWSAFERVDPSEFIKSILCGNQLRNAYLKSCLPLDWFKLREKVTLSNTSVRPSFMTKINGVTLVFEVFRKNFLWQNLVYSRIPRYDVVFSNPENSLKTDKDFYIILNGENLEHNAEINSIIQSMDLSIKDKILFTEDLLQFGSNFYQSIYGLNENNEILGYLTFS